MTSAFPAKATQWPRSEIKPDAVVAWLHLRATLAGMGHPPCARAPAVWLSDHEDDQAAAVEACRGCPAVAPCAAYARAANEPTGTWGGTTPDDRSRTHQPRGTTT